MSIQSQFSLSMELTRAIPQAGLLAQKGIAAVLQTAKLLTLSGSDIVIEEDLAAIFSKVWLDPNFESRFKQSMVAVTALKQISKVLQIYLQSGAGITVQRALQDPYYMPLVVQLSMLCHVHDIDSLAEGLSEALRLRATEPDSTSIPPPTSAAALRGVLQACADQTSGFDWSIVFSDVANKLEIPRYQPGPPNFAGAPSNAARQYESLPVHVLQAALDMMAAVQRLYKDRIMVIEGWRGAITMVVWAHHVLGLTVRVNGVSIPNGGRTFKGSGDVSVIINFAPGGDNTMPLEASHSTYLMNASDGFKVCLVSPADDSMVDISPERKVPIEGFIPNAFRDDPGLLSVTSIAEMSNYSAALAHIFAMNLHDEFASDRSRSQALPREAQFGRRPIVCHMGRMRDSCLLLLGDIYDRQRAEGFAKELQGKATKEMSPPPSLPESFQLRSTEWNRVLRTALLSAYIILSFAAVGDLSTCRGMLLRELGDVRYTLIGGTTTKHVERWDGHSRLLVDVSTWFGLITELLCGRRQGTLMPSRQSVLWCRWGWSVYLDCLAGADPYDVCPGKVWIQRGVPYHNKQAAHSIVEGNSNLLSFAPWIKKKEESGVSLNLRCAPKVNPPRYMVAFLNDAFIVTLQYNVDGASHKLTVGHKIMDLARWEARTLENATCEHDSNEEPVHLGLGVAAVEGFVDRREHAELDDKRILVSMVYGNEDARWVALASAIGSSPPRYPVLRGPNTCVSCFVRQACRLDGDLWLII
jgi:hypothetical protein